MDAKESRVVNPWVLDRLMAPFRCPEGMPEQDARELASVNTNDEQDVKQMFRRRLMPLYGVFSDRAKRITVDSLAYYLRQFKETYGEDVLLKDTKHLNPLEGLLFAVPLAFPQPERPFHLFKWLLEVVSGDNPPDISRLVVDDYIEVHDVEMGNQVFSL